ncbi:MAG: gliding motility-associated ABC transporter ATP-binding subunit GldA, partial [Bacteroidia bacterium]
IINNGQIVANDITSVLQNYQAQNKQFISVEFDKEANKNSLKNIDGVFDAINVKGNIWQIEAHTDKDIRPDIFQYAVKNGLAVLTLHKEEQRLEDVFKQLTK